MPLARVRRRLMRRKIEAVLTTGVVLAAGGALATQGPLLERRGQGPVAELLTRPVAPTVVGELTDRLQPAASKSDLPRLPHEEVDRWIARMTGPMKPSLGTYIRRMQRYEDMIVEKATAKGLPADLVYLAMIESGGNPTALSPVKARGLWQFMSPTAKAYGLDVSGAKDDRIDPVQSTDAALRYLNDLYERFGSWYLAAAAYNGGQGRVARVMKEVTGSTRGTDADFYRIAHKLPKETRDYVPKMIAVAHVASDPERFGLTAEYIASRPLVEKPIRRAPARAVAKKPAAKNPAARAVAAKKATARTVAAKKPAARATAASKSTAGAVAAKKPAARATAASRSTAGAVAAKKPAARTTAAKKPTARAVAAKKPAARSPAKRVAAKTPASAPVRRTGG
jgi:membrane-bound lytic murein transglycosylase D